MRTQVTYIVKGKTFNEICVLWQINSQYLNFLLK